MRIMPFASPPPSESGRSPRVSGSTRTASHVRPAALSSRKSGLAPNIVDANGTNPMTRGRTLWRLLQVPIGTVGATVAQSFAFQASCRGSEELKTRAFDRGKTRFVRFVCCGLSGITPSSKRGLTDDLRRTCRWQNLAIALRCWLCWRHARIVKRDLSSAPVISATITLRPRMRSTAKHIP